MIKKQAAVGVNPHRTNQNRSYGWALVHPSSNNLTLPFIIQTGGRPKGQLPRAVRTPAQSEALCSMVDLFIPEDLNKRRRRWDLNP